MAIAPSGELTTVMIGKESSFAAAATPTVALICSNAQFDGTNDFIQRPGARKRIGRTKPATGMFLGKGSLECEADPDTLGALLKLVLGAEAIAADAANPTVPSGGATTLSGASAAGATVLNFTAATGYSAGNGFRVDAGLATQEDFVIASVASNAVTVTQPAKYAHASSAAVAPCVLAYDHTFTLASPRSSFTAQIGRGLDTINCIGNKAVSLDLSISPKSILMAKLATAYANEAVVGSPVTPTYSTLMPFIFETQGNFGKINGVASTATIQSFGVQVQTGLATDYPAFGNGRIPAQFPEQTTAVSGPLTLAFETTDMYKNFWGNSSATGPQSIIAPLTLDYKFISTDNVNATVPFSLELFFGLAMISTVSVPLQVGKYLVQSCKFEMYESTNGASDDCKAILVNGSNAASI